MRLVIAMTGASGMMLAYRLVSFLEGKKVGMDVVLSQSAQYTASVEMGKEFASLKKWGEEFSGCRFHLNGDVGASICSGSYRTDGMVIIPCSMSTLAAIAVGLSDNAIRRAADVTLKERRRLIIVPRETPLGEIHLENMLKLARRGATILPPVPGWYTRPKTVEEVENFIVGKVLDQLGVENDLYPRWPS